MAAMSQGHQPILLGASIPLLGRASNSCPMPLMPLQVAPMRIVTPCSMLNTHQMGMCLWLSWLIPVSWDLFTFCSSTLVATTDHGHLQIFAPERHKMIHRVLHAHSRAANYVKFLDNTRFASCSDDTEISLWDLRKLDRPISTFRGHSYLVKNIEYDPRSNKLITSAFDGLVNTWDISENPCERRPQTLLKCLNLLRMRLTHDLSKMIISTSDGFLMVIHDLDLDHLSKDLKGFNCELYHMMQKGSESLGLDMGSWYNHLFTRSRNRVEIISDFPPGDVSLNVRDWW